MKDAIDHVVFSLELCLEQYRNGRPFFFEHPAGANSWTLECIRRVMLLEGVYVAKFDFCMLGMKTVDDRGEEAHAKKRTTVMTNSPAVATLLREAQCRREHVHQHLLDHRAGACQKYPEKFAKLVCEGIKRELDTVEWRNRLCKVFDISQPFGKLMALQAKIEELAEAPEEEYSFSELYEDMDFVDDVTGAPLDKDEAVAARKTEITFFKKRGVHTKVRREPWMKVLTTKWLDVNKGDDVAKNYRARLVGREIKRSKRDDLFAATPPLESLRMILSICASRQSSRKDADNFLVMTNDVKRAYFYAPASRPIYIQIPAEDWETGDDARVGRLNLSLYRTRGAAMNWTKKFTEVMTKIGFVKGGASPCNFHHPGREVSTTVHGDDFTSTGREADLMWLDAQLKAEFETKTEVLGPGQRHQRQLRVLNRVLTWTASGIQCEADQRHAEILVRELGMDKAKPVSTPGSRDDAGKAGPAGDPAWQLPKGEGDNEDDDLLDNKDATSYRGLAARANYLAQDRPDLQYAVKEIARRMARPTRRDWQLLKRLARHVVGTPRVVYTYEWQSAPSELETYADSDWAGCKSTRRSTSGGRQLWEPTA